MSDIETFEEFCNNNNCSTCRFKKIAIESGCSNCEKHFMKEHDAQIRAEAIDDFLRNIISCCHVVGRCDFDDLITISKQLKEQKK